jgi:hypothetical protein
MTFAILIVLIFLLLAFVFHRYFSGRESALSEHTILRAFDAVKNGLPPELKKMNQKAGKNKMKWPGGTLCLYASGEVDFQIFNAFDQPGSEPIYSYQIVGRVGEINENEIEKLLMEIQKYKDDLLAG